MNQRNVARALFWLLMAAVLFFALVPGPAGEVIKVDAERHVLAFLVLPAVAFFAWPEARPVTLWLAFAALGGAIEIAQGAMQLGRSAQWSDWIYDLIATTLSLGICYLLRLGVRAKEASA